MKIMAGRMIVAGRHILWASSCRAARAHTTDDHGAISMDGMHRSVQTPGK